MVFNFTWNHASPWICPGLHHKCVQIQEYLRRRASNGNFESNSMVDETA